MTTTNKHQLLRDNRATIVTGEADIDVSAADYTGYQALLTIAPQAGRPIHDVEIVFDLAKADTGFAAGHTTETITFAVQRKVDGSNWRTDFESQTTAVSGTNAASGAKRLDLGTVTPNEQARVVVKLSAENAVDVELPFVISYRGEEATVTPAEAG